jgi:hypothetical protein
VHEAFPIGDEWASGVPVTDPKMIESMTAMMPENHMQMMMEKLRGYSNWRTSWRRAPPPDHRTVTCRPRRLG